MYMEVKYVDTACDYHKDYYSVHYKSRESIISKHIGAMQRRYGTSRAGLWNQVLQCQHFCTLIEIPIVQNVILSYLLWGAMGPDNNNLVNRVYACYYNYSETQHLASDCFLEGKTNVHSMQNKQCVISILRV